MKKHRYYMYLLTNPGRSVLYCGVTNNLARRLREHAEGRNDGFTKTYRVRHLVYYEEFQWIQDAIAREKQVKKWLRRQKEALIATMNPTWAFLEAHFLNTCSEHPRDTGPRNDTLL